MEDDLLTLLQTSKIFSSLSKRVCRKLATRFEKTELEEGDILYFQGDPSDSLEILLSGKLESILTTADGEKKVVGEINAGETAGELGALSGEPRSTTIKALRNSILFRLPSEAFVEICHQYPSVLFAIINPIVTRSHQIIQTLSSDKFRKHILLIAANNEVDLEKFSEKLIEEGKDLSSLIILSDYSEALKNANAARIQELINEGKNRNIKKIKQRIVYILKSTQTELAKFCLEKAESLYIVTQNHAPAFLNMDIVAFINQFKAVAKIKPELVIVHQASTALPHHTNVWLKLTEFGLHHHIRIDRAHDFRRLIRFIRNKAIGVVLSGGGTRGWAHAGALKALFEAGIPIDAIGGTSVGAIVAGSFALTLSHEETLKQFDKVINASRYSVAWRSLTWPAISLFNAKGLTTVLQKIFDNIQIEDLWLPYFCVSTNLSKNAETIHRTGPLWIQIRSSVSIPGVIPPMVQSGELHFDGGLLNNLPVDIMRKMVTHRGTIVAIELVGSNKDEIHYSFPPILPFWATLLSKLGFGYTYKFPRFIDTFLKSLLVGSFLKAQQNSINADIFVGLDLSKYPMLHSNQKVENKIVEIGYNSTMERIKNMTLRK